MAPILESETAAEAVSEVPSPGTPPVPVHSLGTPFSSKDLDTPASESSLTFSSPSTVGDITERIARLRIVSPISPLQKPSLTMRPGEAFPENGKSLAVGLQRTFSSSKRLQQALGLQVTSTPFKAPPPIPSDICLAYEEGLKEYGLDIVREEKEQEDPEYAEWLNETNEQVLGTNSDSSLLGVDTSVPKSGCETEGLYSDWLADPLEPLADDEGTITENCDSSISTLSGEHDCGQGPATQVPSQSLSIPYMEQSTEQGSPIDDLFRHTAADLGQSSQYFDTSPNSLNGDPEVHDTTQDLLSCQTVSDPPASTFSPYGSTPSLRTSFSFNQYQTPTPSAFFSTLFKRSPAVPEIVITPSSPRKSCKRYNHDSEDFLAEMASHTAALSNGLRPAKKKIRGESVNRGLPVVPVFASAAWTKPFPGNSEGLSFKLLTWHSTMSSLYSKINNPNLMAVHPMFPYPPNNPVHIPLVSGSFWDTSMEPHKELWFIGPGDVELLSYNEVDTFSERRVVPSDEKKRPNRFRQILKNFEASKGKAQNHSSTGDGRWCFIVVRGHQEQGHSRLSPFTSESNRQDEDVAPFVVIAFPKSAMTKSTECLQMLYPDSEETNREEEESSAVPPQVQPNKGRFSSHEALDQTFRQPSIGKLPLHLRQSSPNLMNLNLPTQDPFPALPFQQASENKGEPWTLRRTILWFDKAGSLPLIEGYRTDVARWRPFLEAVGRGQGKIVMFCETDK